MLLENLRAVVKAERDQVLADAWNVLANYVAGSVSNFITYQIRSIGIHPGVPGGPCAGPFDPMMSKFPTLTMPFFVCNFRSWSMVKQCVDATYADIRKREFLAELHLRIIEVQCSSPVMWVTPSQRISQAFPMVISRNSCHTMTSPAISANEDTYPNRQSSHLSLYASRVSISPSPPVLTFCVSRVTVAIA